MSSNNDKRCDYTVSMHQLLGIRGQGGFSKLLKLVLFKPSNTMLQLLSARTFERMKTLILAMAELESPPEEEMFLQFQGSRASLWQSTQPIQLNVCEETAYMYNIIMQFLSNTKHVNLIRQLLCLEIQTEQLVLTELISTNGVTWLYGYEASRIGISCEDQAPGSPNFVDKDQYTDFWQQILSYDYGKQGLLH